MAHFISSYKRNSLLAKSYTRFTLYHQTLWFDRYRNHYNSLTFNNKKKLAQKWLKKYPEQAHFDYPVIDFCIKNFVRPPRRIIELSGWRGDLALKALNTFSEIDCWHNYDLLENCASQKCTDPRYTLITLKDYIWNHDLSCSYNSLIVTHMIEHLSWNELTKLIRWILRCIRTVLLEAPLPGEADNHSWMGDQSSRVLERGWLQICKEMQKVGFTVNCSQGHTYIYVR